jgi:large subunit ribosomal protein L15e
MSLVKYLKASWKRPKDNKELWRQRLISFRKEPVTMRIDRPTRPDRARALGYKAKQGVFIVRQRVKRGGHRRPIKKCKRSKRFTTKLILHKNYRQICEERANKKFPNSEVLNSYWVAKDGKSYWYEVIMVDRTAPQGKADKSLSWVKAQKGRTFRGLTSAGKRSRGLRNKGKGSEKARPSRRAHLRKN